MIDINASLGSWPFGPLPDSTPAGMLKRMDSLNIKQACVAPFEGLLYKDVQDANRLLHSQTRKFRDRLIPFAVINPAFPGWREDLDQCITELHCAGVRLFPSYHSYELSDDCVSDLMSVLQKKKLPVQIAPTISDPRMHHPRVMVPAADLGPLPELLKTFPKLKIAILNINGYEPLLQDGKDLQSAGNFFFDTAGIDGVARVELMGKKFGLGHVLFGTNAPVLIPLAAVYKLRETDLTPAQLERITRKNAERFLGKKETRR
jgi:hypothetical protein